jgi:hypothetical protein
MSDRKPYARFGAIRDHWRTIVNCPILSTNSVILLGIAGWEGFDIQATYLPRPILSSLIDGYDCRRLDRHSLATSAL